MPVPAELLSCLPVKYATNIKLSGLPNSHTHPTQNNEGSDNNLSNSEVYTADHCQPGQGMERYQQMEWKFRYGIWKMPEWNRKQSFTLPYHISLMAFTEKYTWIVITENMWKRLAQSS